ncbi:MAG: LamG domain-containing protein, partial [Lentisphaerae bacterium]|nr:LamG domain-containing protein [Lentisphaerota bacterium]
MLHRLIFPAIAVLALSALAAEDGLLLHYSFDEGSGKAAQDSSANALHGTVNAQWVNSPSGKALFLDGTPTRILNVQLPEDKRFSKDSWTLMAWLKPTQFTINDKQNQRRLFAFGTYPGAYLVVDLHSTGAFSCYFCYKTAEGKTVSTGASSGIKLEQDNWAHIALVVDRAAGNISCFVNGYCGGPSPIRKGFDGDYVLGGGLTLGSSWHNYWGAMDEVWIYRRAVSEEEVTKEFHSRKDTFGVKESEQAIAARKRDALMRAFDAVKNAWGSGDHATVRRSCAAVVAAPEMPPHFRSYAHLRIAQSFATEKNAMAARGEYVKISSTTDYPATHRHEAAECVKEIDRVAKGLSARDPLATRTKVPRITTFAAEVYVAPGGSDANDGTRASPLATLQGARDAVRAIRAEGVDGPTGVRILPGEYAVTQTLELSAEDSGTEQAPIVYRAEEKGKAVFYGGKRLSGFTPVADPAIRDRIPEVARDKVMQCYLRAAGITDYGELKVRGFGQPPSPPTLELFFDGRPLTLARWPNEGFVGIKSLIESGSKKDGRPSVFEYVSDRHARWTQASDAWLFGYFRFLWADATIKIGSIDTDAHTITTAEAYHYGQGMETRQGIAYYAFNLLEEIDAPGEWYLDRESGILYVYPPSDPNEATVEIGMLSEPMVVAENVSDVRFEGLAFDLGRYNCMLIKDSTRCLVAGCTVSRMAGNGITI